MMPDKVLKSRLNRLLEAGITDAQEGIGNWETIANQLPEGNNQKDSKLAAQQEQTHLHLLQRIQDPSNSTPYQRQEDAGYMELQPGQSFRCANCQYFSDGFCKRLEAHVLASSCCNLFEVNENTNETGPDLDAEEKNE